ncbi:hypothetical protein Btru_013403 [Bulinus truncatus]|nr:hypothetical protein Btru_013403 [Bulinus truncatus]
MRNLGTSHAPQFKMFTRFDVQRPHFPKVTRVKAILACDESCNQTVTSCTTSRIPAWVIVDPAEDSHITYTSMGYLDPAEDDIPITYTQHGLLWTQRKTAPSRIPAWVIVDPTEDSPSRIPAWVIVDPAEDIPITYTSMGYCGPSGRQPHHVYQHGLLWTQQE